MGGDQLRFDAPLPDLWDDEHAASLDEPGQLLYRSNLLGGDLRITNFGGGNTSAKVAANDPLTGAPTKVLWVKGSGGDIGSMKLDGFSTLYLDKLLSLKSIYRGLEHEDEMVALYDHCTFNLNPRATSIDTPLHEFVPHAHVDHVHADAVIAIAASEKAEALTREIYGGELGFLPWQRPGFDLGLKLGAMADGQSEAEGRGARRPRSLHLGSHLEGLLSRLLRDDQQGGPMARRKRARSRLRRTARRGAGPGGPARCRGEASARHPQAYFLKRAQDRALHRRAGGAGVRQCSRPQSRWLALGTSCPDHFLRTKIRPLVLPLRPGGAQPRRRARIARRGLYAYRADYAAYYERCKRAESPAMRDPNAVIYLVPGVGMFSFAKDKATARIAAEFYVNAINVMRGAPASAAMSDCRAGGVRHRILAARGGEAQRMPKPKSLAGRIA